MYMEYVFVHGICKGTLNMYLYSTWNMYMYMEYVFVHGICICTWNMYMYVNGICICTWNMYMYMEDVYVLGICICTNCTLNIYLYMKYVYVHGICIHVLYIRVHQLFEMEIVNPRCFPGVSGGPKHFLFFFCPKNQVQLAV